MSASTSKPTGVRALWSGLSPERKAQVMRYGTIVMAFLVLLPILSTSDSTEPPRRAPQSIDNILTGADTRELGLTGVSQEVEAMQRRIDEQAKEIARLTQAAQGEDAAAPLDPAARQRLGDVERRLQELERRGPEPAFGTTTASTPWAQPTSAPPPTGTPVETLPGAPRTAASYGGALIETVMEEDEPEEAEAVAEAIEEPGVWVPSGSFVRGVLLTGADVPTGRAAQSDPVPVLIRIQHEAILPNHQRLNVRECFVIGAATGDLPTERVYIRSEALSCVRTDGKVIDTRLEMYAAGEDGKTGLRSRLVERSGKALAAAGFAGFADAVARAFQPNNAYISSTGLDGPSLGDGLTAGAYGASSTAFDRISRRFLDLADQLVPILECDAKREVHLIVLRGAELKLAASKG